jgi:hypothetical protein
MRSPCASDSWRSSSRFQADTNVTISISDKTDDKSYHSKAFAASPSRTHHERGTRMGSNARAAR